MVLATLLGVVIAFDIPARQSFLMDMVGREDLFNAIALNSSMFNGARIIGPAVAGLLVAWIGEGWCFFANGVSYVAVIAGLLMMRLSAQVSHLPHAAPFWKISSKDSGSREQPLRCVRCCSWWAWSSLVAMPYTVLMPIFARQHPAGRGAALGLLMGATGVGALLGSLALASKTSVQGLGRWVWVAAWAWG